MTEPHEHQFTPEDTQEHLRGLQASVDLIDLLIAQGIHTAETHDTMDRNVSHIGIMCALPHICTCGSDLSPFTAAANRGAAWMAHPLDE